MLTLAEAGAKKKSAGARWKLHALVLGIMAICVEIGLRSIFGLGNPVLIQADQSCGYTLKPNQDVHRFFVWTFINKYGMRSADFREQKPTNSKRIMFLGDSITYGTTQVDQAKIFTELVRRQIEIETAKHIEALNASAGAWAISNEVAFVKSRGLFGSDLLAVVINRGDLSQSFSTVNDVGEELKQERPALAIGELLSKALKLVWLRRRSRVDAGIYVDGFSTERVQANLEQLSQLQTIARKSNARMVIVYLPLRRDLKTGQSSSVPAVLLGWAKLYNVPLLDLTSAECSVAEAEVVTQDHAHLNALGNALVSKPLAKFLVQNLK